MATMIWEVYDAFIAAGAREEKARKAAESIANYENRFSRIEADLLVLKWMTGTILGGVAALVVKNIHDLRTATPRSHATANPIPVHRAF